MLTTKQNKIISDLREEFAKLNKLPEGKSKGGLINRTEIDNAISESARILAEHHAVSASLLKAMKEKVSDDVKRLNEDLEGMGLIALDTSDIYYAKGRIKKPNSLYDTYNIRWEYVCESKYIKLPNGTTHSYKDEFSYIYVTYMVNGNNYSDRFKSIEEVFANENIKKCLISLYQYK